MQKSNLTSRSPSSYSRSIFLMKNSVDFRDTFYDLYLHLILRFLLFRKVVLTPSLLIVNLYGLVCSKPTKLEIKEAHCSTAISEIPQPATPKIFSTTENISRPSTLISLFSNQAPILVAKPVFGTKFEIGPSLFSSSSFSKTIKHIIKYQISL